jgi:hypothetical protein
MPLDTMRQFITQNYKDDDQKAFDLWCAALQAQGSNTVDESMFVEFFLNRPRGRSPAASASDSDKTAALDGESGQEKRR